MRRFAFVHGAGDSGWAWQPVVDVLRAAGHVAVAPDLPAGDPSATLADYADVVLEALSTTTTTDHDTVVIGHSYGAFTAPLIAARLPRASLVFVTGMVPSPGEAPADWWSTTGYQEAAAAAGPTVDLDPRDLYYHDVPDALADEALRRGERDHPSPAADRQPWPLDHLPDVPTTFVVCSQDRVFPAGFQRRLARARLGIDPIELCSGHCPGLGHPNELAAILRLPRRR